MAIQVRKGQGDVKLNVDRQISEIIDVAWNGYDEYRKSPRKRKAGPGFADPGFELPIEWLEAEALVEAVALARAGRFPRMEVDAEARPK